MFVFLHSVSRLNTCNIFSHVACLEFSPVYEMCSMNKAFLLQHLVVKLQEKDREVHQLSILLDTEKVLW